MARGELALERDRRAKGRDARERRGRGRGTAGGGSTARARTWAGNFDAQHEIADVDLVPLAHDGRLGDLAPIDVSAVHALQVGDDDASVAKEEPGVALGNIALREQEIVP